ncbi:MAG: 50S ribosomal protein L18 [Chloroflexi bacterium]|nr:50S ribosomal protein L18 [Chloroflexota bacterium]
MKEKDPRQGRKRRHARVRTKIYGTDQRPRLSVFRSLKHIYAQVIDDTRGHSLGAASTQDGELRDQLVGQAKAAQAKLVGALVARRALEKGITEVVFDRGGYKYHGRVKALAEAVREAGLKF